MTITELKTDIENVRHLLSLDFDHAQANRLHDLETVMFASRPSCGEEAVIQMEFLGDVLLEQAGGLLPAEDMLRSAIEVLR